MVISPLVCAEIFRLIAQSRLEIELSQEFITVQLVTQLHLDVKARALDPRNYISETIFTTKKFCNILWECRMVSESFLRRHSPSIFLVHE